MFDQRQQQIEGFWCERHTLAVAQQQSLCNIKTEWAEFEVVV